MVRPGHRTHHPLPARAILPRDPARRTAQPGGTRGRYERGLVSQTSPHLQRHTRRCTATFLAGTGFRHVPPSRRGEETPTSAPGGHYLCALPRCLMAKVELSAHQEIFAESLSLSDKGAETWVYLLTLVGLAAFYGLERF